MGVVGGRRGGMSMVGRKEREGWSMGYDINTRQAVLIVPLHDVGLC